MILRWRSFLIRIRFKIALKRITFLLEIITYLKSNFDLLVAINLLENIMKVKWSSFVIIVTFKIAFQKSIFHKRLMNIF